MKEQKKGDLFMETNIKKAKCIHHWMIRNSNDEKGISIGICKKCNEKKEFNTYFIESHSWGKKKKQEENKKR